jgi:hypothetical protein
MDTLKIKCNKLPDPMNQETAILAAIKVCVESGDAKVENADEWINKSFPRMIHRYEPTHTFNKDETVLYFSLMPDKTLTMKGKSLRRRS